MPPGTIVPEEYCRGRPDFRQNGIPSYAVNQGGQHGLVRDETHTAREEYQ